MQMMFTEQLSANIEADIRAGTSRLGNLRAAISAEEIITEILFLSQMLSVIVEKAGRCLLDEDSDRRIYEGHGDQTKKGRLIHIANCN